MKRKIAVEDNLTSVKDWLMRQGYEVTSLDQSKGNLDACDAVVVSGQDDNVMGIQSTTTKVPVINATGMSATEVYNQLQQRLR